MTYAVKRYLGYQPWGVVNPWGFADLSQPQRRRVPSYYIWQTHPPRAGMHPLGAIGEAVAEFLSPEARDRRMEVYSLVGLGLTSVFVLRPLFSAKVTRNRSRRRRYR